MATYAMGVLPLREGLAGRRAELELDLRAVQEGGAA